MEIKFDILPVGQKHLWQELGNTPDYFVLYGGIALALRLGHRQSVDFNFFAGQHFHAENLYRQISYLKDSEIIQLEKNILTCSVVRSHQPIKISFFGGLEIVTNPIQKADSLRAPEIHVASLPDLVATKLLVIQQRAEKKDYLDIAEILRLMPLSQALYYAKQLYGKLFNPFASLKALTYFEDGFYLK